MDTKQTDCGRCWGCSWGADEEGIWGLKAVLAWAFETPAPTATARLWELTSPGGFWNAPQVQVVESDWDRNVGGFHTLAGEMNIHPAGSGSQTLRTSGALKQALHFILRRLQ